MAASAHLKTQTQTTAKPKRRKRRETTITTSATSNQRKLEPTTVVSPETSSWCCSATSRPPPPPSRRTTKTTPTASLPPPEPVNQNLDHQNSVVAATTVKSCLSPTASPSSLNSSASFCRVRFSPGRVSPIMDSPSASLGANVAAAAYCTSYPCSYSKFNSALNAGILNPSSPPPCAVTPTTVSVGSPIDKTRSSPTLFEMMANEADCHHPRTAQILTQSGNGNVGHNNGNHVLVKPQVLVQDKQAILQQRVTEILGNCSPGNQFNDPSSSDLKLTLTSKDGLSVSINLHCQILVAQSRFFATKLCDKSSKQHQPLQPQRSLPQVVEISDCDDVEIYIETLRLMYCKDIRRKLMKEDVPKVLGILKVSAAIYFDAGVLACLEYLEAVPWPEDEEEKVASLLSQLHLEGAGAGEVLKRVSVEVVAEPEEQGSGSPNEEVLLKLLQVVLQGKDEKARRDMKSLVSKMLRENSSQNDLSKESLYTACTGCLQILRRHFLCAASSDLLEVAQISRQADNLHWILDILIDRQIAEDFLKTWAAQSDLSEAHSNVPAIHRYDVSRVTARLLVGIGKGQLLASKEDRCLLLQTWLEPFYDDFAWMRRASRGLDRHLIEDGLCNTILTLPLAWQQQILLAWFDRFLNSGEDCPNIQRGFQVWWRRAFWKRNGEAEHAHPLRVVTTVCDDC